MTVSTPRISSRVRKRTTCFSASSRSDFDTVINSRTRLFTAPDIIPRGVSMTRGAATCETSVRAQMNEKVRALFDAPLSSWSGFRVLPSPAVDYDLKRW